MSNKKPILKAIIAVNKIGFIGKNNGLPWKSPDDLNHFKALTKNTTCLVGRKTFEYLPPLKDRTFIVLGKNFLKNLDEVLKTEAIDWVIGGKSIYEQTLPLCEELHLSIIDDYTIGDVTCPDLNSFTGEIFIYNFSAESKLLENKKEITRAIQKFLPDITDKINFAETWRNYLKGIDKYPEMKSVCRNEIFEQQLIKHGWTKEQAAKFPKNISCPCPKCTNQKLL